MSHFFSEIALANTHLFFGKEKKLGRGATRLNEIRRFTPFSEVEAFFSACGAFFSCLRKYPHILGCPQNYHYVYVTLGIIYFPVCEKYYAGPYITKNRTTTDKKS